MHSLHACATRASRCNMPIAKNMANKSGRICAPTVRSARIVRRHVTPHGIEDRRGNRRVFDVTFASGFIQISSVNLILSLSLALSRARVFLSSSTPGFENTQRRIRCVQSVSRKCEYRCKMQIISQDVNNRISSVPKACLKPLKHRRATERPRIEEEKRNPNSANRAYANGPSTRCRSDKIIRALVKLRSGRSGDQRGV